MYFHDGKLCIIGEHLDVSLFNLEFKRLVPEEWEIATIITTSDLPPLNIGTLFGRLETC
jgi:hypothetical protein